MATEQEAVKTSQHDHLVTCPSCFMPVHDIRDCICDHPNVFAYFLCGNCREEREQERAEEARNRDYP